MLLAGGKLKTLSEAVTRQPVTDGLGLCVVVKHEKASLQAAFMLDARRRSGLA